MGYLLIALGWQLVSGYTERGRPIRTPLSGLLGRDNTLLEVRRQDTADVQAQRNLTIGSRDTEKRAQARPARGCSTPLRGNFSREGPGDSQPELLYAPNDLLLSSIWGKL